MSVVPQSTSTSPASSAPATSCSARASIVPPPTRAPAPGRPSRTAPGRLDAAARCRAARPASCPPPPASAGVPADEVEQRVGGHRGRRVDGAPAARGRGWRRPGPARSPAASGACARVPGRGTPAARRCRPAGSGRRSAPLAPPVAVEQPGPGGRARRPSTAPSDGTMAATLTASRLRHVMQLRRSRAAGDDRHSPQGAVSPATTVDRAASAAEIARAARISVR